MRRPLLTGFQSIVDWPGAYFWAELSAAHPEAKVVLTLRDPERWNDSIQGTIFSLQDDQLPEGPRDMIFTRTSMTRQYARRRFRSESDRPLAAGSRPSLVRP